MLVTVICMGSQISDLNISMLSRRKIVGPLADIGARLPESDKIGGSSESCCRMPSRVWPSDHNPTICTVVKWVVPPLRFRFFCALRSHTLRKVIWCAIIPICGEIPLCSSPLSACMESGPRLLA